MSKDSDQFDCFAFYVGNATCEACPASRRCKALLTTDGIDILEGVINHLVTSLPEGTYRQTDRVSEIVDQLLNPPEPMTQEELELLRQVSGEVKSSDLKIGSI